MQVSVESTSALERRMTVGVPVERIETEVNKRLQQTARRAKVPGFRPGKVPMSVIRQRYEDAARQEALGDLIQATFYEAVVEQKLNPAGAPAVEPKVFEKGKDLEYVATFEVFPEFTVGGFESIAIERLHYVDVAQKTQLQMTAEKLRSSVLSALSHDLRTPLTSILGNADSLISNFDALDEGMRKQIFSDIYEDAGWLIELVENLLALTKIEDGSVKLQLSDQVVEDVVWSKWKICC